jgi:hypothetical protein
MGASISFISASRNGSGCRVGPRNHNPSTGLAGGSRPPPAQFDAAGAGNVTMVAGLRSIVKTMELPPAPAVRSPAPDRTWESAEVQFLRATRLWQYSSPGVDMVFDFRMGREGEGPKQFLGGFEWLLQADGYKRYNEVSGPKTVHACCLAPEFSIDMSKLEAVGICYPESRSSMVSSGDSSANWNKTHCLSRMINQRGKTSNGETQIHLFYS